MFESGYKISDLPIIPTTEDNCLQQNKIAIDETYFLGYSHTIYGTKYNTTNYQIPLQALRDDFKGYVGIESLTKPWTSSLKFWHGDWYNNTSKNKSYVYDWTDLDKNNMYYSSNKFSDLENSYYIINDAPFPFETEDLNNRNAGEITPETNADGESITSTNVPLKKGDPYTESNKIVLKKYVDDRVAAKRLVEVKPTFRLRDYDCNYVIRSKELESNPNIVINYSKEAEERLKHNALEYSLLIEGKLDSTKNGYNIYVSSYSKSPEFEFYNSSGEKINIIWLNKDELFTPIIPDLASSELYNNSKYIIINFRTIITEEGYEVYGVCENLLYSSGTYNKEIISSDDTLSIERKDEQFSSIFDIVSNLTFKSKNDTIEITKDAANIINFESKNNCEITSSDNTIIVEKTTEKYNNNYDLKSNIQFQSSDDSIEITKVNENTYNFENRVNGVKPTILVDLPTIGNNIYQINLNDTKNKAYYTYAKDFTLNFIENLEEGETFEFKLYLNTGNNTDATTINAPDVFWVMSPGGETPNFYKRRLYSITFKTMPSVVLLTSQTEGKSIFGSVDWFYNLDYSLPTPTCIGSEYDISTFENGVLTLNWPTKTCGEAANTPVDMPADFSSHLQANEITEVTGNTDYLISAESMFANATNLLTCNLSSLDKLENGIKMFSGTSLSNWNINLPSLENGKNMFWGTKLSSWEIDLSELITGTVMFYNVTSLVNWNGNLSKLINGNGMFEYCPLVTFESNLDSLVYGQYMFENNNLSSWDINLPNIVSGFGMFYNSKAMTSCVLCAPNLTNAQNIFGVGTLVSKLDNTLLTDLGLNMPKMTAVILNAGNASTEFGSLVGLRNVVVETGGLASVETFTFSKDAVNLTYQSMLNVANELPTYSEGEHIYTCPEVSTTKEERTNIRNIVEPKGWNVKFLNTTGEEVIDDEVLPEATCLGSSYDTSTFADGVLTLNWPTKSCGNTSNVQQGTSSYFANHKGQIKEVTGSVPELVIGGTGEMGEGMFFGYNLTSVTLDSLGKVENGTGMFEGNNLTSWNIDLPDTLTDAVHMFYSNQLTSWDIPLPDSLTDASIMFYGNQLTSWNIPLPDLLTDASHMFRNNQLTSCRLSTNANPNMNNILSNNFNLTDLSLNLPNLPAIDLASGTTQQSFVNLTSLVNVTVDEGGLASVGTFTFSKDAVNLTYQSMLNVANELPTYSSGEHIYTCPVASTTITERNNIRNIVEPKGWNVKFLNTSGDEIIDEEVLPEVTCLGSEYDTSTFDAETGVLTLNWPTKSCGNTSNVIEGTNAYFANYKRQIKEVTGSVPELVTAGGSFYTEGMFNDYGLTSVTLDSLGKVENATHMFSTNQLTSWNIALPDSLTNASYMFYENHLTSWDIPLPDSLTNASGMFQYNQLSSWNIPLPDSLTNANYMFSHNQLTSWDIALPDLLTNASNMFAINQLTSWNASLPDSLTNASYMFQYNQLSSWNIPLPDSLTDANYMFSSNQLTSWNIALPDSLTNASGMFFNNRLPSWDIPLPDTLTNASYMFQYNQLTSWNVPLPDTLTNAGGMFSNNQLTSWNVPLPDTLTNASSMFSSNQLTSWNVPLPDTLTNAGHMFSSNQLTSWNVPLPDSLIYVDNMFRNNQLTSWDIPLPDSLTNASGMFSGNTTLTDVSFNNQVASGLTNCTDMFQNCKALTTESCQNIVNMLPDVTNVSGTHTLGVQGVTNWTEEMTTAATAKGWTVTT